MTIQEKTQVLLPLFRKIILLNELGGNLDLAYQFSDPDGRSGKSGYSFGICQFDLNNNGLATHVLLDCGFSPGEIAHLKGQGPTPSTLSSYSKRLKLHASTLAAWDDKQLAECLTRTLDLSSLGPFPFADDTAILVAADYHNQFFISKGGQFFEWAKHISSSSTPPAPITAKNILDFKLAQPWGRKRPDDVRRRFNNVLCVVAESRA